MLSAENWRPIYSHQIVDWKNYEFIPSITVDELCCLLLGVEPLSTSGWIEMAQESECESPLALQARKPIAENSYRVLLFRVCNLNEDIETFSLYSQIELCELEIGVLSKIASKFEMKNLPPIPEAVSGNLGKCFFYIQEFHSTFYQKMFAGGWWERALEYDNNYWLGEFRELRSLVLYLAGSLHRQVFSSIYLRYTRIIHENKVENGGKLRCVEGSNRISFADFVEWADGQKFPLPDGFPRVNKAKFDYDSDLSQAYKVIVQLLDLASSSGGNQRNQSAISSTIAEKNIPGLGKRTVDGILSRARKACKDQ